MHMEPVILVAKVFSNIFSSNSRRGVPRSKAAKPIPALLTRASKSPYLDVTSSTAVSINLSEVISISKG